MEKVIKIKSVKYAPTKNGQDKYTIETNDGNMSVWDSPLAEKLNKRLNTNVSVEIRPAPEGTNYMPTITDMNDASDGTISKEVQQGERANDGQAQLSLKEEKALEDAKKDEGIYRTPKEISAQTLTGFVAEIVKMSPNADMSDVAKGVLKTYKDFLEDL